jgi:hypothetical protein
LVRKLFVTAKIRSELNLETLNIREILNQVQNGQIRIPAFQRGFVWEPDRVAFFIDSIYKNYPYGSLLFWRAKEKLKIERDLGPFKLSEPKEDYPVDYVLDGQQRITSIYATFQNGIEIPQSDSWKDVYYDFSIPYDSQDTQFFALMPDEVDSSKHFPVRVIFDTVSYRRATAHMDERLAEQIDKMQSIFKEAKIPVQIFKTDEKSTVAVIFERINRQGVKLDTLQLLSAWTWSEDFQLQTQFDELSSELEEYGYKESDTEENLLLRCCSAILAYDPSPDMLVEIPGSEVRNRFDEVINGIKGALDFLKMNLNIHSVSNLPFQTILVPLAVYFAISGNKEVIVSDSDRKQLIRWFWRTSFSKRYSSGVLRYLKEDIEHIRVLKAGQESKLGNFSCNVDESFFFGNCFNISAVNTKTFILLLASKSPLSLISGMPIDLASKLRVYNKTEFHHLIPKAFLKSQNDLKYPINCLSNFAFVARSENRELGGEAPSIYKAKLPTDIRPILSAALCPESLFSDDFNIFIYERSRMLLEVLKELIR